MSAHDPTVRDARLVLAFVGLALWLLIMAAAIGFACGYAVAGVWG